MEIERMGAVMLLRDVVCSVFYFELKLNVKQSTVCYSCIMLSCALHMLFP